jgi:probable phosphoglycerate mutase
VSSPLGRARETMELLRSGLGLEPSRYRTDARLMEMSFGRWEGFTFAELQATEADALAARERDKWGFVLPGGESYAQLSVRVRAWYESIERDTVVAAHGGVARALMAHLGIEPTTVASVDEIGQGVVFVFGDGIVARHD